LCFSQWFVLAELFLDLPGDGGVDQGHLAEVPVGPEQEVLAHPPVIGEVELGMFFLKVVVDVDDVRHGAGQRQGLLEAGAGVEEDGGAADLA